MKRFVWLALAFAASAPLSGGVFDEPVVVERLGDRTLLARDSVTQIIAPSGVVEWSAEGLEEPSFSVLSEDGSQIALIDSVNGVVNLLKPARRTSSKHVLGGSPVAALFLGDDLYVLCRDSRKIVRVSSGGMTNAASVPHDSTFIAAGGESIFVYSRVGGIMSEFRASSLTEVRQAAVAPFGSDLEIAGETAYVVVPQQAVVIAYSLVDLSERERYRVGAVPMDLVIQEQRAVQGPGVMVVADPSSQAVWRAERSQSVAAAFTRGFLKGLTGLGLGSPKSATFPTGVDRVWMDDAHTVAYDSAAGAIYDVTGPPRRIAGNVPAGGISVGGGEVVFWDPEAAKVRRVKLGKR
jgi:hypothetical protein